MSKLPDGWYGIFDESVAFSKGDFEAIAQAGAKRPKKRGEPIVLGIPVKTSVTLDKDAWYMTTSERRAVWGFDPASPVKGRPVRTSRRTHFGGPPPPRKWWHGEVDQFAPDDAQEWGDE